MAASNTKYTASLGKSLIAIKNVRILWKIDTRKHRGMYISLVCASKRLPGKDRQQKKAKQKKKKRRPGAAGRLPLVTRWGCSSTIFLPILSFLKILSIAKPLFFGITEEYRTIFTLREKHEGRNFRKVCFQMQNFLPKFSSLPLYWWVPERI